ncbi:unnamed protein product [Adineta steineri]|uniref:Uncharacterized protein n=1 Tax=Adineta steineri TaxID=433720 RepID=A0A814X239_9BILA|nr:unnamed protein product [Adineta steineri]CAF1209162.1 unnamed protein product [Adineta steineri]
MEHRQRIKTQLETIINDHDQFQQTIIQQKEDSHNSSFIQQINQWETNSIHQIQQTAEECRKTLMKLTQKSIDDAEKKFIELSQKLKEIREENEFYEIDLNNFQLKLTQITEEFLQSSNISIRQDSQEFIKKISVVSPFGTCFNSDDIDTHCDSGYCGAYMLLDEKKEETESDQYCVDDNGKTTFSSVSIVVTLNPSIDYIKYKFCTTDKYNNQTSLQRILNAFTLEENFQPFDVLFNNNSKPFTEQNPCTNFSNSTHFECPTSGCFLSEMESIREICARCPKELPNIRS